MLEGQELQHTVTTTVNAESQHVLNSTTLKDGDNVIFRAENEINIPLGEKYHIDIEGDVNSKTIARSLNVLNNLIGQNAFTVSNKTESTDTTLAKFTASYNPETLTFSGTAPLDSTVRIILEDGANIKTEPGSDSTWSQTIVETQLQYGLNNVVVINGAQDSDVILINIERQRPVEPFTAGMEYDIAADGMSISGTVEDIRGTINITAGAQSVDLQPADDQSWSHNFARPLDHGQEVRVTLLYQGEMVEEEITYFYQNTADLDLEAGTYISGTANPFDLISVEAEGYEDLEINANEDGEWNIDFYNGLINNSAVKVFILGELFKEIIYTGPSGSDYQLSVEIITSTTLEGAARPGLPVTIVAGSNPTFDVMPDASGQWAATLGMPLLDGQSVYVSSNGEDAEVFYIADEDGPIDPIEPSSFSAEVLNATTVQGTGDFGEFITVYVGGEAYNPTVNEAGNWTVNLNQPLDNLDEVTATNGLVTLDLVYVFFEAVVVTKTQINGIAPAGTMVSAGENTTIADDDNTFKLYLTAELIPNDTVSVSNEGETLTLTYIPEFTAFISGNGDKILGTSNEPTVTIQINGQDEQTVSVIYGEYSVELETPLASNDQVSVTSGQDTKQMTFTGVRVFNVALNPSNDRIVGNVDASATIRVVYSNNIVSDTDVAAGDFDVPLSWPIPQGEGIVVACIAGDTFTAIELYAA